MSWNSLHSFSPRDYPIPDAPAIAHYFLLVVVAMLFQIAWSVYSSTLTSINLASAPLFVCTTVANLLWMCVAGLRNCFRTMTLFLCTTADNLASPV